MRKWFSRRLGQAGRFRFFTLAILLMIGLHPFIIELSGLSLLTDLFFLAVLFSGSYAIRNESRHYWVAIALAGGVMLFRILKSTGISSSAEEVGFGLYTLFLIQVLLNIGAHIERQKKVTLDLIFAAACAYLLLGLIWANAYYLLEKYSPGSFKGIETLQSDLWDFIYFSFVTLTTTGYGDISAATKPARSMSILEAVIGQLYLAMLVGRLVGAYSAAILDKEIPGKKREGGE